MADSGGMSFPFRPWSKEREITGQESDLQAEASLANVRENGEPGNVASPAPDGPPGEAPPPAAPAWMNDPARLAEFAERLAACGTRAFRHPAGLELTFEAGRKAAPASDSGRW